MTEESDELRATDAAESEFVLRHAKELGEHFDAVVVLCTRHEGSRGTRTVAKGCGNWHAQVGVVREWMVSTDERTRQQTVDDLEAKEE